MSDVFISYSRKDKVFARRLFDRLSQEKYSTWADWIGIPYSAKWMDEIRAGIDQSDNFIFVISPDSLTSKICNIELEHARQKNKRIIPIVRREPDIKAIAGEWFGKDWEELARTNWAELGKQNYIFFRKRPGFTCNYDDITREVTNPECDGIDSDADDFEQAFLNLFTTTQQDPEHSRQHTRYLVRAQEWELSGKREDDLLIGREIIAEAEEWLKKWQESVSARASQTPSLPPIQPVPLPLHETYIKASRNAETIRVRNLSNIRRARKVAFFVALCAFVFAIVASLLGVSATAQVADANATLTPIAAQIEKGNREVESLRLAVLATGILQQTNGNAETAALLSIRALKTSYTEQADSALSSSLDHTFAVQSFKGPACCVAYSPDGSMILIGGGGSARLFDRSAGNLLQTFNAAPSPSFILSLAFSPDGRTILTGTDDTAQLWDVKSGGLLKTFTGHSDYVISVSFSPDGRTILTGSRDKTARLWDIETGKIIYIFKGHSNELTSITFSPDGLKIATASIDGKIILWDVKTGALLRTTSACLDPNSIAFSPDGQNLAAGCGSALRDTSSIKLWDVASGNLVHTFSGDFFSPFNSVNSIAFSPNGNYILSGQNDATARLWDAKTGVVLRVFSGHLDYIYSVAFSPDGNSILTASRDKTARLWSIYSSRQIYADGNGVAYSPDAKYFLTSREDGSTLLWAIQSSSVVKIFKAENEYLNTRITSVAFSPDGRLILTGSLQNAKLWNIATGKLLYALNGHSNTVTSVAFSPDGHSAASASADKTAILWDISTGNQLRVFSGHSDTIDSVTFSPDGRTILTDSEDGTARLWDKETGDLIHIFAGIEAYAPHSAIFSPNGKIVATHNDKGDVQLWNVSDFKLIRSFNSKVDAVGSIAFNPDGSILLVGSSSTNGAVRLWDVATGTLLRVLNGHTDYITDVAYSPDGRTVLTRGNENYVRLWDTDYRDFINYGCSRVFRDFTSRERYQFGITDKEPTCPQFANAQYDTTASDIPIYNGPILTVVPTTTPLSILLPLWTPIGRSTAATTLTTSTFTPLPTKTP